MQIRSDMPTLSMLCWKARILTEERIGRWLLPDRMHDGGIQMLTELQIKEEALKRVETMDPSEKAAMEEKIRSGFRLVDKVVWWGDRSLTRKEYDEFMRFELRNVATSYGGDSVEHAELENEMKNLLGASRDEIAAMQENPFIPAVKVGLLITAAIAIGGFLIAGLISGITGWDLRVLCLLLGLCVGTAAFHTARLALRVRRFRKLQESYRNPDSQEKAIDAAVYRIIHDRIKEERDQERERMKL